ncbi:hypothetical protein [Candidatus Uabimicrobium sp. HlEnr_7]|uniref:hypothetical protein n=1 Tax=Candidatus Uabimicrobium helgolandensis TaxID=3095367 RepID=UPI00355934E8
MFFDPQTKKLYAKDGTLIKKLHCPLKMHISQMQSHNSDLFCHQCDHTIINTANLTEKELQDIVRKNPEVCVSVSSQQKNVIIQNNLPDHFSI